MHWLESEPKVCAFLCDYLYFGIAHTSFDASHRVGSITLHSKKKAGTHLRSCFLSGVSGGNRTHDLQGHNLAL